MLPVNTDITNASQWPAMTIPIGKTRDYTRETSAPVLPVGLDLRDVEMVGVRAAIEAALEAAQIQYLQWIW